MPMPTRPSPAVTPSGLKRSAIVLALLAPANRILEEPRASDDEHERPPASEGHEAQPAEVVEQEDRAEQDERDAPGRRFGDGVLRDGRAAGGSSVQDRGAAERIEDPEQVREGDPECEGQRVDLDDGVDAAEEGSEEKDGL